MDARDCCRSIALILLLALLWCTPVALAQEAVTPIDAVVRRVNVRAEPATGTTPVLGSLAPGERAAVIGDVPGWFEVRLSNGTEGYVSKRWVRPDAAAAEPATGAEPTGVPFTLHVVDVGTGDGILLDVGEGEMLLDGGLTARPLLDYVSSVDIIQDPVELAVVTHSDSDHWKGLEAVIERYPLTVGEFWEPGYDRDCEALETYDAFITEMKAQVPSPHFMRPLADSRPPVSVGDTGPQWFTVDSLPGVEFLLLHTEVAPDGPNCAFRINNASIVFKVRVGGVTVLFTGDANGKRIVDDPADPPKYVEAKLLALEARFPGILHADILKVGHHGSETASTDAFLQAVHPRIALISASGRHDLPRPTVITRLELAGAEVFSTGISTASGDNPIVCEGAGDGTVECHYAAP